MTGSLQRRAANLCILGIFNPFYLIETLDEFNNMNKPVSNPLIRYYNIAVQQDLAYCITDQREYIKITIGLGTK